MIEKIEDWKKYDNNKPTMVFNVLYLKKNENIYSLYFRI